MMGKPKHLAKMLMAITALMIMMSMRSQTQARAYEPKPKSGPTWAKTEVYGKERTTVLQFYFHDNLTGDSVTAIPVVLGPKTKSFTEFGAIIMADDPLTVGPDPSSKLVGRAQGFYGFASMEAPALIMGLSLTFLDGIYNGSTISILALNPITHPEREFPVVGGTGVFRMARGYALAKTYFFDVAAANAIVGYTVTIIH